MQLLIRRRPLLYVVGLLIPSIFLMSVDVVSFYLPLNSGTRIAFKISILLGYTVFRVNLTDELPASAINTPLIGRSFHSQEPRTSTSIQAPVDTEVNSRSSQSGCHLINIRNTNNGLLI